MAKSIPTVSGSKTLGGTITINTNRDNSTYKHTLRYTWGSQIEDEFIAENITTSYTWTIPKELANYIITATAGTMVLRLITFDANNNFIGSSSINFTVTMPDTAEFNPKIVDITLEEVGTPTKGLWIQKQSKIKGTLQIINAYGTSALNYKINANGMVYTTRIFETDVLLNSGENEIVAIYTDKRGRKATFTKKINVQAYDYPHIESASITRASGTTANLKIVGEISSTSSTKSFYYKYKLKTATNYGSAVAISNDTYTIDKTITVSGLQDAEYDFLVGLQDEYTKAEKKEIHLPSSYRLFNVSKDKKKFAFFGKAVKEGLQVFGSIFDRFGTEIRNGLAAYGGSSAPIDPDTTIEELTLTNLNTPTASFWYVKTMFYSTKSATANRTQVAYPFNAGNPVSKIYYRYYAGGVWSDWNAIGGSAATSGIIKIGDDICIQYGSLSARVDTGNTAKQISFNFNTPFSQAYKLIPVLETSAVTGCQVAMATITASSGSIWFNRTNTSATIVHWIAIGKLR